MSSDLPGCGSLFSKMTVFIHSPIASSLVNYEFSIRNLFEFTVLSVFGLTSKMFAALLSVKYHFAAVKFRFSVCVCVCVNMLKL